jgi:hypothetical protein
MQGWYDESRRAYSLGCAKPGLSASHAKATGVEEYGMRRLDPLTPFPPCFLALLGRLQWTFSWEAATMAELKLTLDENTVQRLLFLLDLLCWRDLDDLNLNPKNLKMLSNYASDLADRVRMAIIHEDGG